MVAGYQHQLHIRDNQNMFVRMEMRGNYSLRGCIDSTCRIVQIPTYKT